MRSKPILSCLLLPLLAAAATAWAQVGEARRPPVRIEPAQVRPAPPARVPRDLSARPRQEIAIPATGPSPLTPRPGAPGTEDAGSRVVDAAAPAKVYDRTGRLIPGAVRVGPNRVYDPRSGRYRDAQPRGDDLQVVPGD
ncbi:hypothetical protein [Luteimonas sp. R10]|uniref:hypothetical protein n=1 Tax=Luteimonas sp. R10 TaxID=3108176 RepID=UPI00308F34E9|nr:hypothetical protein U3649_05360 [Luteimonas sp. R10]